MGLFSSIFQRKSGGAARTPPAETSADAVQEARTRARRRLIGAVVLVVIGVIGFPLLFETQPRPIPVDIPIDIPRKETAPPLATPVAKPPRPVAAAPAADTPASSGPIVTETVAEAGRDVPPPAARPASAPAAKPASAPKPATVAAAKPAASAAAARPAASAAAESRRAKALLEGEGADKDPAGAGRFVVQVGAFSDAAAARDTRQKIEKLGLKTYTQVAETASGSRIRVRVGPFASRDEAERAQARIKAAGASAVVLTL